MNSRVRFVFKKNDTSESQDKSKKLEFNEILYEGFVELLGELKPKLAKEIVFSNKGSKQKNPIPLYEYTWTVGIRGDPSVGSWCEQLYEHDSIVVQIIFHTHESDFSFREISADLKQLPPFKKKDGIGGWIESIRPAAKVFGRGLETMGLGFGKILTSISEMKLNSASPKEFPWYIKSISVSKDPAVEWHISRSYLQSVGNRFVGTLVGYFVDCGSNGDTEPRNIGMEIKVFLQADSEGKKKFFISHFGGKEGLDRELYGGSLNNIELNLKKAESLEKKVVLEVCPTLPTKKD